MTLRKSQGVGTLANQLASQADSLGALIFLGSAYQLDSGEGLEVSPRLSH